VVGSSGNYTVTYTDANGCSQTSAALQVQVNTPTPATLNLPVTNYCESDLPIILSGGLPGGGNYIGSGVINNILYPALLPSGLYNLQYVTIDANGCLSTATSQIIEPALLSASATNTAVLCNGGSSGSVQGTATGGIAPYNMSWVGPNTGNPVGDEITTDGGSYTVNGAPAGNYTITMTDGNGCIATTTTIIVEPILLQVNAAPVPPLCNGVFNGSMNVIAIGGTAPYDVSWSGPNSDNPVGTEITTDGGSYIITGVGAGTYTITLTDGNGCIITTSTTLVPPVALTINTQPTDVACSAGNTGSIQVTANNGTPGYNVSWSGSATGNPTGVEINISGGSYSIPSLVRNLYRFSYRFQRLFG
jgi:hypothetical protein